jgi:hypothetical protein
MEQETAAFGYLRERYSGPCSKEPLAIRDMRPVVNGERRSRTSKVLTGAFVPWSAEPMCRAEYRVTMSQSRDPELSDADELKLPTAAALGR